MQQRSCNISKSKEDLCNTQRPQRSISVVQDPKTFERDENGVSPSTKTSHPPTAV